MHEYSLMQSEISQVKEISSGGIPHSQSEKIYGVQEGSPDLHVSHVHLRSGAHEHVDPGELSVP